MWNGEGGKQDLSEEGFCNNFTEMKFLVVCIAALAVLAPCSLATLVQDGSAAYAQLPESVELQTSVGRRSNGADQFVLLHGSFHGAWCWYKVVTMLKTKGYKVAALDLTSLGRARLVLTPSLPWPNMQSLRWITSQTPVPRSVILVGHSSAGTVLAYLMELMPEKIEKAVFLAALMPVIGVLNRTQVFDTNKTMGFVDYTYANGPSSPPTSFFLKREYSSQIFYNESPEEDITQALSLLSPQPMTPLIGVFHFSAQRYGSVRRFYIQTMNDRAAPTSLQEQILESSPPERVYQLDSDHSAFFSKSCELTSILEIVYNSQ
ncbi:hypothetical protein Mapa_003483 [Marchantia paleacea]|nr:hypothetical protein Mapa_003483 [Marchantia paleacea]